MTPQLRTAIKLSGVAAVMLSLSFIAVPFYDWFCRVTGFAGTTSVATAPSDIILDQTVLVRFDAGFGLQPADFLSCFITVVGGVAEDLADLSRFEGLKV